MRKRRTGGGGKLPAEGRSPTLKELAKHLGLAPATVSTVMNGVPSSGIAPETQQRILEAARKLNYRPNFLARCLRTRRSFTVGVLVPEISQGYNVLVLRGIEEYLLGQGYFYLVASHHLRPDLIDDHSQRLIERAVDGLIVVCAPWHLRLPVPVTTISSHHTMKGTTSVLLDHYHAAELGLRHLADLGHRKIAFIKGRSSVPDTDLRWKAITDTADRLGLAISPKLVATIVDPSPSSLQVGYEVTRKLLSCGERFTALFAFNDVTAMGAVHALNDSSIRVPDEVSVLGFDDIEGATYQGPGLTTIRQPLEQMGRLAAQALLERIAQPAEEWSNVASEVVVQPELVVRETTAVVASPRLTKVPSPT